MGADTHNTNKQPGRVRGPATKIGSYENLQEGRKAAVLLPVKETKIANTTDGGDIGNLKEG